MSSSTATPLIHRGHCTAVFAADIAVALDLDHAERLVASQRETLRPPAAPGAASSGRRAPAYFEFKPPPLRVRLRAEPLHVGGHSTLPEVDLLLFDFGAVCVGYRFDLSGRGLSDLLELSEALFDCEVLAADARRRVEWLTQSLHAALTKPGPSLEFEDYLIYEIQEAQVGGQRVAPSSLLHDHGPLLAQILRSERIPLGPEELADALACRVSYTADDAAVIDWNAAVLLDRDAEDVRAVLEFANVELLEMRFLDDRLDEILDTAYRAAQSPDRRGGSWRALFPTGNTEIRRLAQLQTDAALLFENVNNALKLIGDQYLARVYRLAAQRFHLPERDQTIERKLAALESIYTKLHDHEAGKRADYLTWAIILLILFEIVIGFTALGH